MCLLETRELLRLFHVILQLLIEVLLRELAISWYPVVESSWLIVPQVLEACHVRVTDQEWHVGVAIIDSAKLLTFKISLNVVFHDWGLNVGGMLRSSGLAINAITESKDVGESLVLEGVWAHINHTIVASDV